MGVVVESEEQDLAAQVLAGQVLFYAQWAHDGEVTRLASDSRLALERIQKLSGCTPTRALVFAGCVHAALVDVNGGEIDIVELVHSYFDLNQLDYIERTMLGALRRLEGLLARCDAGLKQLGVPDDRRSDWVLAGLDFPDPSSGAANAIWNTYDDVKWWDAAQGRIDAYLEHVALLPRALRRGDVHGTAVDAIAEAAAEEAPVRQ